jgi:hypothetical protein
MTEIAKLFPRSGTKFICELPQGDGEWRMMPFKGQDGKTRVIVINPNHPPYIIEDGVASILMFDASPLG